MTTLPQRIQLRRTKGWKMPANTVKVDRTTKWGNPYTVDHHREASEAVKLYREWMCGIAKGLDRWERDKLRDQLRELRGKNLACWCKPGAACHADVLLEIANA